MTNGQVATQRQQAEVLLQFLTEKFWTGTTRKTSPRWPGRSFQLMTRPEQWLSLGRFPWKVRIGECAGRCQKCISGRCELHYRSFGGVGNRLQKTLNGIRSCFIPITQCESATMNSQAILTVKPRRKTQGRQRCCYESIRVPAGVANELPRDRYPGVGGLTPSMPNWHKVQPSKPACW